MAGLQRRSGGGGSRVDQPLKSGTRPRFGLRRLEKAGAVLVGKYNAHHVKHELPDVEVCAQVSLADGELNGAAELTLQAGKVVAYRITNSSRLVVELNGSGLHRTPMAQSAARRPIEPVLEQGAPPRESAFGFERGDEHGFGKARRS